MQSLKNIKKKFKDQSMKNTKSTYKKDIEKYIISYIFIIAIWFIIVIELLK
jgi:hypothetical protein